MKERKFSFLNYYFLSKDPEPDLSRLDPQHWMNLFLIVFVLTLIRVALEENLQILFKPILHHDALS